MFVLPDYATRFDGLSLSCCLLKLNGPGTTQRQATGFFWRHVTGLHLITNWHVVTGRNILDGTNISNAWCPESIDVQYFTNPKAGDPLRSGIHNPVSFACPQFKMPLYEDFHAPFWFQHQETFERSIDLVALKIDHGEIADQTSVRCVNDRSFEKLLHLVGSDVFVLGYPLPYRRSEYPVSFPIWKRGSIASEIIVPWNMRPAFLIDSRTSDGMSGSPVFARAFGPSTFGDGTIRENNILASEFMGVYSGRLFDDSDNASIGIVWHRNLIDQMLDKPSGGSRDWIPSNLPNIFRSAKA